jgi:hypothetical protein
MPARPSGVVSTTSTTGLARTPTLHWRIVAVARKNARARAIAGLHQC